ncbi:MAG: nucleotidyltransferase family protein [Candidatus Omnitrophica bacterium]|nr:nucleotidyltransferase family protein [Candidatus Omnitrophota bacterium]
MSKSNCIEKNILVCEKLLLLCANVKSHQKQNEISQLINQGINWQKFLQLAYDNAVSSLTFNSLKFYLPINDIEREALQRLKISYQACTVRNIYYKEELKKIISLLMDKGIKVIPLKGIFLSERLYGDASSRDESVDLDLLIRQEDRAKARPLIERTGYVCEGSGEIKEWEWVDIYSRPKRKIIELHWDITMMARSKERIEGFWQGAQLVEREGIKYYDFLPEELLLYLSAHLTNSDSFRKLRSMCDIDRLLEKYGRQINWDSVVEKSGDWHLRSSLYAALKLQAELFEPKYPRSIVRMLGISLPKRLFINTFANKGVLLKSNLRRRILDNFLAYTFFEIIEASSFNDYLAITKRIFFPPRDSVSTNYILRIINGISKILRKRDCT